MTRKPDEIKRKLNDLIHVHYHHGEREPHMTPLAMVDLEELHADALALIQQLEAQNAELSGEIGRLEAKRKQLLEKIELLEATSEEQSCQRM